MCLRRIRERPSLARALALLALGAGSLDARASVGEESAAAVTEAGATVERYAIHGQLTYTEQQDNRFEAPYHGPNSLTPGIGRETADATLYLGARLWHGAELWVNPEIDQGFGLDDTLGLAAFPSGEAYKVGRQTPYFRLPRAFIRQSVDVGTPTEEVEGTANQLAGRRSTDRWVFTFGKFGVPDVFDTNQYAHDPRADFMNWAAIDASTFDYAADAWGFTVGASAEWYHGPWAARAGFFDLSNIPNSERLEPAFREFQLIGELERRYQLGTQPGKVLVTGYESDGRMGLLAQALSVAEQTDTLPDIAAVRHYRKRTGLSIDLEQQLATDLGLFARAGKASGNVEVYEFTDVDQSLAAGLSLKGMRWHRPLDTLGVAALQDSISGEREQFLNAGGLGILVGDGRLPHAGPERAWETYYSAHLVAQVFVTGDFQRFQNPAYNRDRGPVTVLALRVHAQF